MQCPRAETAWLGWRPVDFPNVCDIVIALSARKTSLHMAQGVPASVRSSVVSCVRGVPASVPSRQLHPQGSARQSTAKTPASVPFLKMKTDIIRRVSFLGDPVAFWRGREGRVETNQGGLEAPWEAEPLGQRFGLFHIKNLLTAQTAQPLSWRWRQGCLFFLKGFKRSLFYCKSDICSLFKKRNIVQDCIK